MALLKILRWRSLEIYVGRAVRIRFRDLLDAVENGESAAILRGLTRYFEIFTRRVVVDLDRKYYLLLSERNAGDIWINHERHPFRQVQIG